MAEELKCKYCQMPIDPKATICPHCRKKVKGSSGCFVAIIAVIGICFLLFLIGTIITSLSGGSNTSGDETTAEKGSAIKTPVVPKPVQPGFQWRYTEEEDKMVRGTVKTASVLSTNKLNFDFPYQGAQNATLYLRTHPKYGKDVILKIERGQFMTGLEGCNLTVRFDSEKPETYHGSESADNDSTVVFIRNYDRFVSKLKKAKKVAIEAPFYQEGNRVIEFNVDGLKW